MDGMIGLRCDTLDKLKQKLPELRAELRDDAKFRLIYDYAYLCVLDPILAVPARYWNR